MIINNLHYIDSLRWIAIILVLIVHSRILLTLANIDIQKNIDTLIWYWQYWVVLFFLVSSYTLFRSLSLRKENNYKFFFLRRFFRIAPLYYLIIVILFFTTSWIPYYLDSNTSEITISNLLLHILFLNWFFNNMFNSIIWVEATIFIEVWFYLLLPFIYIYRKKINFIFIFFLMLTFFSFIYLKYSDVSLLTNIAIYKSPLVQFIAFIPWCYMYIYEKNNNINNIFIKYKNIIALMIIISLILLSFYTPSFILIIMILLFSLFFMIIKNNKTLLFNNKLLSFIWKISYSLYLIHFIIIIFVKNNYNEMFFKDYNIIYIYFIVFWIIFIISTLSYHLIEIPFMKFWKKIINNLK